VVLKLGKRMCVCMCKNRLCVCVSVVRVHDMWRQEAHGFVDTSASCQYFTQTQNTHTNTHIHTHTHTHMHSQFACVQVLDHCYLRRLHDERVHTKGAAQLSLYAHAHTCIHNLHACRRMTIATSEGLMMNESTLKELHSFPCTPTHTHAFTICMRAGA